MRDFLVILLVFILGIQLILAGNTEGNNKIHEDLTYRIIQENEIPNIKRSIDVRINCRVSEDELHEIAQTIKNTYLFDR